MWLMFVLPFAALEFFSDQVRILAMRYYVFVLFFLTKQFICAENYVCFVPVYRISRIIHVHDWNVQ